jgi:hypothetical protein
VSSSSPRSLSTLGAFPSILRLHDFLYFHHSLKSNNMSLPKNNSDHDPGHTATHGDYHDTAKSPKPSSHKRVDSGELGGIGAQFRRPSKADSIPRPSDIDIDDEAVQIPQPSAAGDLATGTHEDRSVSGVRGAHHYSKEDVALLIHHRDRGCEEGGMCIPYSLMCSLSRGRCCLNIHSTFHPLVLIPTNLAPLSSS